MSISSPKDSIWLATERGDVEAVRRFVEADGVPDVEENDYDGSKSLLTLACRAGQVAVVRYFMEIGYRDPISPFDPQVPHVFAATVPHAFAALEENHLDVLRVLCEFDLDVNAPSNKHGPWLTEQAVYDRNLEAVQLLLEFGGEIWLGYDQDDAEVLDSISWTYSNSPPPLEVASLAGDRELVKFLLRAYPNHSADDASVTSNARDRTSGSTNRNARNESELGIKSHKKERSQRYRLQRHRSARLRMLSK